MKILKLDTSSGISGDMTVASLLALDENNFNHLKSELSKLKLDDEFEISITKELKSGILATKLNVIDRNNEHSEEHHACKCGEKSKSNEKHHRVHDSEHCHQNDNLANEHSSCNCGGDHDPHGHHEDCDCGNHDHHHEKHTHDCNCQNHEQEHGHDHSHGKCGHHHTHGRTYGDIKKIISDSNLGESVKSRAILIFDKIAAAEAAVHGKSIDEVHFHEVGAIDSIIDIVSVAILLSKLKIDKICCSVIATGSGLVKCQHGILPVPAPATAILLKGFETDETDVKSEMTTPTGAAILQALATQETVSGKVLENGFGCGSKTFENRPNVLKATIFEVSESQNELEQIFQVECNFDDEKGEVLGYVINELVKLGANDAFITPIIMKKSRPGQMITFLCKENLKDLLIDFIFKNTSTIGVRFHKAERKILLRKIYKKNCDDFEFQYKISQDTVKIEFESIKSFARNKNISIKEAEKILADNLN